MDLKARFAWGGDFNASNFILTFSIECGSLKNFFEYSFEFMVSSANSTPPSTRMNPLWNYCGIKRSDRSRRTDCTVLHPWSYRIRPDRFRCEGRWSYKWQIIECIEPRKLTNSALESSKQCSYFCLLCEDDSSWNMEITSNLLVPHNYSMQDSSSMIVQCN